MTFTFTIPVWTLWALGVSAVIIILLLACAGAWFIWTFRNGIY